MTLPKSWIETSLGQIAEVRKTKADPASMRGSPFIGLEHIEAHTSQLLGVGRAEDVRSSVATFVRGDILYGRLRPYLNKVIEAPFDGCASAELVPFVAHDGIDRTLLRRWMMAPDFLEFTASLDRGDRPRVKPEQLKDYPILLPPEAEQRRIVAKLDALTARLTRAREELDRVPMLAAKMRESVLVDAFEGALTASTRNSLVNSALVEPRPPADIRKKYQASRPAQGPYELPSSWRWLRLPELGELDRGKSKHRPRNDARLFGGKHPFVQTGEVRTAGQYLTGYSKTYSDFGLRQSKLWPKRTVCITIAANIAETTILGIEACFPDSVVGFLCDKDKVLPEYIEFFIRTAKADLARFAPATAQKNINLDILAAVAIPVAPLEEQRMIVESVTAAFNRLDRLEAEAAKTRAMLDRLEAAILARAFRGELVPQDPEDEPATVLLDRIRAQRAAAPKPKRGRKKKASA